MLSFQEARKKKIKPKKIEGNRQKHNKCNTKQIYNEKTPKSQK